MTEGRSQWLEAIEKYVTNKPLNKDKEQPNARDDDIGKGGEE